MRHDFRHLDARFQAPWDTISAIMRHDFEHREARFSAPWGIDFKHLEARFQAPWGTISNILRHLEVSISCILRHVFNHLEARSTLRYRLQAWLGDVMDVCFCVVGEGDETIFLSCAIEKVRVGTCLCFYEWSRSFVVIAFSRLCLCCPFSTHARWICKTHHMMTVIMIHILLLFYDSEFFAIVGKCVSLHFRAPFYVVLVYVGPTSNVDDKNSQTFTMIISLNFCSLNSKCVTNGPIWRRCCVDPQQMLKRSWAFSVR